MDTWEPYRELLLKNQLPGRNSKALKLVSSGAGLRVRNRVLFLKTCPLTPMRFSQNLKKKADFRSSLRVENHSNNSGMFALLASPPFRGLLLLYDQHYELFRPAFQHCAQRDKVLNSNVVAIPLRDPLIHCLTRNIAPDRRQTTV